MGLLLAVLLLGGLGAGASAYGPARLPRAAERHHLDVVSETFKNELIVNASAGFTPSALVLGDDDSVFICGSTQLGTGFGEPLNDNKLDMTNIFITKVGKDGKTIWTKMLGSEMDENCNDMSISDGRLYLVGWTEGVVETHEGSSGTNSGTADMLMASLHADSGALVWVHQHAKETTTKGWAIHVYRSNLYLAGHTSPGLFSGDSGDSSRMFLATIGTDGAHKSMKGKEFDVGNDISAVHLSTTDDMKYAYVMCTIIKGEKKTESFALHKIKLESMSEESNYVSDEDMPLNYPSLTSLRRGGAVVSATAYSSDKAKEQLFAVKITDDGDKEWTFIDGVEGSVDEAAAVFELENGKIAIVGDSQGNYGIENMRGDRSPVVVVLNEDGEAVRKYQMDAASKEDIQVPLAAMSRSKDSIYMVEMRRASTGNREMLLGTFGIPSDIQSSGGETGLWRRLLRIPNTILVSSAIAASLIFLCMTMLVIRRVIRRRRGGDEFNDIIYEEDYENDSGSFSSPSPRIRNAGGVVRIPKGYVHPS
mmetsp:Transcript_12166/g.37073  ORF Transcript_12166/g.37073 Transcript_12166/m.37073 type:complete len:535 (-) Transcript_12166:776-2380(-)